MIMTGVLPIGVITLYQQNLLILRMKKRNNVRKKDYNDKKKLKPKEQPKKAL